MSLESLRKEANESIDRIMDRTFEDPWDRTARLNRESLERQRESRERRAVESSAGGSGNGGIYDISTNFYKQPERNKTDQGSDIDQRGIDSLGSSQSPQSGEAEFYDIIPKTGIVIFPADGDAPTIITTEDIFSSFNPSINSNWSIELTISDSVWTGAINYSSATALFDAKGSDQTVARIPVSRLSNLATYFGSFQEGIRCVDGEPVVEFYGI